MLSASILARLIDDLPRWHSADLQEQFLSRLLDIADHSRRDEREAIYLTFTRLADSTLIRTDLFFRAIARLKLLGNLINERDPSLRKLVRLVHGILKPRANRRTASLPSVSAEARSGPGSQASKHASRKVSTLVSEENQNVC
jgi:hypothetical protein